MRLWNVPPSDVHVDSRSQNSLLLVRRYKRSGSANATGDNAGRSSVFLESSAINFLSRRGSSLVWDDL